MNYIGVTDRLYGTRSYMPGAMLQVPRKVPMRVEPKSYFANERTFLSWIGMAIMLGGISSLMAGFVDDSGAEDAWISKRSIDAVSLMAIPVSIIVVAYCVVIYRQRSLCLARKDVGFSDDWVGAVGLGSLVTLCMIAITALAYGSYFQLL